MRVLILQYDCLDPPVHGGAHETLAVARMMAKRGIEVEIVAPTTIMDSAGDPFLQTPDGGWNADGGDGVVWRYRKSLAPKLSLLLIAGDELQVAASIVSLFERPEVNWLMSSESGSYPPMALDALLAQHGSRWIYLPKTVHCQPFGPLSVRSDPAHAQLLHRARLVIAPSDFAADYFRSHGFPSVRSFYFPTYDLPTREITEGQEILFINPSPWKGWRHFEIVAKALPTQAFPFVPGWGTSNEIAERLQALPNVRAQLPTLDRDALFDGAGLLMVPSVCFETFGQVVVQAMIRSVPVVASDLGGLREAGLGVAEMLSTQPAWGLNDTSGPSSQECDRWILAITRLTETSAVRRDVVSRGRAAAHHFIAGLSWDPLLDALKEISP